MNNPIVKADWYDPDATLLGVTAVKPDGTGTRCRYCRPIDSILLAGLLDVPGGVG